MSFEDDSGHLDEEIDAAFDLIEAGNFQAALQLGRRLRRESPEWGFEILALAYEGLDKRRRAIQVLEQGVAEAPDAWRLWQLLGNYRSDEGEFEACHEAYRRALKCPEVDVSSVHLNFAIALLRQEKFSEALRHLSRVTDPQMRLEAMDLRMELFNRLEWYAQAIDLGRRVKEAYEDLAEDLDQQGVQALAKVYAELGLALWFGREDRDAALELTWEALRLHKAQHTAMWLLRELTGEISPNAAYYQLTIQGRWFEPRECDGEWCVPEFLATYEVAADSPEEALEMVRLFEPPEVRDTLEIVEAVKTSPFPDEPKGVYAAPEEYHFFRS